MFRRISRRLKSERASVYLEYALVSCITLLLSVAMLRNDSWFFRGLGFDFAMREFFIKFPIF